MNTIVIDNAQVELSMPSEIQPLETYQDIYCKQHQLRMKLNLVVEGARVRMPDGRTMVISRLVINQILATMEPAVEGDQVVIYKIEDEVDTPITIGGDQ